MRKRASIISSLSLALAVAAAAPAVAQDDAVAAAIDLSPGTVIYDSTGAELGTVKDKADDNVIVAVGDRSVTLPAAAFGQTEKGPALGLTLADMNAALDKMAADADAALAAALQPGTDVRSADGAAVLGKVKAADAGSVVVGAAGGDLKIPRNAFFMSQAGLAVSFTAEQFATAQQQAGQAAAADDAAVAAALTPGAEVRSLNGNTVLGTVKSFNSAAVVLATASGDVSLPRDAFSMSGGGLHAAYTAEQFAEAVAQAADEGATAERPAN